jgi:nucleobase:cation symporter-1, NCS1 family
VLAAANFISNYTNFLFLIGYWVMPWIAITLLCRFTNRGSRLSTVNAAFVRWVTTLLFSVPFYNQTMYTGRFAARYPQFEDCTFIVSFILGGILYLALTTQEPITEPEVAE